MLVLTRTIKIVRMRFVFFTLFLAVIQLSPQLYSVDRDISKPVVIVSIAPYRHLVSRIVEDTFEIITVVPDNADPHTYEPNLKQIIKLKNACLWFKIGEGFEGICARALGKSSNCQIVDLREGLPLLLLYSCQSGHHHDSIYDSHVWLSPKLLKTQALQITDYVTKVRPESQDIYKKNLKMILSELDILDREINTIFEKTNKTIPILVTHGAYGYFCRDYNLKQLAVERPSSADPSLKELLEIMDKTKEHKINKIFLQKQTGTKQGVTLAKKLQLEPIILDPYAENIFANLKLIAFAFSSL